jgi:hypothetical protein
MIGWPEFLIDCVVTIVSDDYESFELILEQARSLALLNGMNATESEVAKAIERAIADGLVQAYILSPREPYSTMVPYSEAQLHELWFYATADGKKVAKSIPELSGEGS